ncbi:MAG TPA: SymE family type I addiction module toxin [Thermoanaerobaculia bacterium]|nr:SymE family type I addiction module toxin [Thermoanaerobaculia bacterium]
MCKRRTDSTTPPSAHFLADRPAQHPAGAAPCDNSFGYRVTEEGLKALAEYEELHGKPVWRKVLLSDTVAEALADDAWRDRQREYRKRARKRGNRLVTICGRRRGGQKVSELRLIGQWLQQAGFDLGRHCEIEVQPGTLTIRVL